MSRPVRANGEGKGGRARHRQVRPGGRCPRTLALAEPAPLVVVEQDHDAGPVRADRLDEALADLLLDLPGAEVGPRGRAR